MNAPNLARTRVLAAPKRSEHVEAVTLMRVVCLHQRQQPELALFFAVPNGGDRNPVVAAKMKAEGVRAGVPDYLLPVARQGFHGLAIELKAVGGSASLEQRRWLRELECHGWRAELCVGWGGGMGCFARLPWHGWRDLGGMMKHTGELHATPGH